MDYRTAVCGSQDALEVWTGPAILYMGQPLAFQELRAREPDGQMLFMMVIECSTCGHTQLFNSDRFYTGDKDILFGGTAEAEAALDAHDERHGGP